MSVQKPRLVGNLGDDVEAPETACDEAVRTECLFAAAAWTGCQCGSIAVKDGGAYAGEFQAPVPCAVCWVAVCIHLIIIKTKGEFFVTGPQGPCRNDVPHSGHAHVHWPWIEL